MYYLDILLIVGLIASIVFLFIDTVKKLRLSKSSYKYKDESIANQLETLTREISDLNTLLSERNNYTCKPFIFKDIFNIPINSSLLNTSEVAIHTTAVIEPYINTIIRMPSPFEQNRILSVSEPIKLDDRLIEFMENLIKEHETTMHEQAPDNKYSSLRDSWAAPTWPCTKEVPILVEGKNSYEQ